MNRVTVDPDNHSRADWAAERRLTPLSPRTSSYLEELALPEELRPLLEKIIGQRSPGKAVLYFEGEDKSRGALAVEVRFTIASEPPKTDTHSVSYATTTDCPDGILTVLGRGET